MGGGKIGEGVGDEVGGCTNAVYSSSNNWHLLGLIDHVVG